MPRELEAYPETPGSLVNWEPLEAATMLSGRSFDKAAYDHATRDGRVGVIREWLSWWKEAQRGEGTPHP